MTPLIQMTGVSRSYVDGRGTRVALADVDFVLHDGELVAVMGPSGSGKSTLLAMAGGLERPSRGEVQIEGQPLAYQRSAVARRLREQIGVVYQRDNLLRDLTSCQNVSLPLELVRVPSREAAARARRALAEVDAGELADMRPDQLSGGERQRVAVARALIGDRRILLADEPTAALETTSAENLMRLIRKRTRGERAAIVATHDQRLAAYADRVIYLNDGRIVGEVRADVGVEVHT